MCARAGPDASQIGAVRSRHTPVANTDFHNRFNLELGVVNVFIGPKPPMISGKPCVGMFRRPLETNTNECNPCFRNPPLNEAMGLVTGNAWVE
jgi:hypothetical protein